MLGTKKRGSAADKASGGARLCCLSSAWQMIWLCQQQATSRQEQRDDHSLCLQAALDQVMKQHTVLVIAHRLSTVQDASRILCALGAVIAVKLRPVETVASGIQHVGSSKACRTAHMGRVATVSQQKACCQRGSDKLSWRPALQALPQAPAWLHDAMLLCTAGWWPRGA